MGVVFSDSLLLGGENFSPPAAPAARDPEFTEINSKSTSRNTKRRISFGSARVLIPTLIHSWFLVSL